MKYLSVSFSLSLFSIAAAASQSARVALPKPTGLYQVGRNVAELIDYNSIQPFASASEPRKLMVSAFFPVEGGTVQAAPYMPHLTANFEDVELASAGLKTPNGTFERLQLSLARVPSTYKADNGLPCQHPVVLFMPAEGTTRLFYSQIASTIASNGYIVLTIDTPYDVDIVQYSDGSVTFLNQTIVSGNATEQLEAGILAVQTRAQDASFVLDSLSNLTLSHSLVPNMPPSGLNTTRVAMFGHSLGGAATLAVLENDDRVVGGINMDGAFFPPTIQQGTNKPFMIMAHSNHTRVDSDPLNSWALTWPSITGWKRDIIINGTLHYDFSDYPIILETLKITPPTKIAESESILVGHLEGRRALQIVTTYVTAFLDMVLYGKCSPLLNGPVIAFPEVSFDP